MKLKKGKILGISNTDDGLWYKFAPEDKSLELLDLIFDIYDKLYDNDDDMHKYQELYFHKETKNFIAYFIFTKTEAHVILRKTLKWKKFDKEVTKKFDFSKKRA
jgi:hypothetical protein